MGGCFIWIIGYIFNVFLPLEPEMRLVYLPKWIIPFLGKPRNKDLPARVLFSTHLGYELSGIFMVIWGIIIYSFTLDPRLFTIIGVFSSLILGRSISKWLYKKFPYTWKWEDANK